MITIAVFEAFEARGVAMAVLEASVFTTLFGVEMTVLSHLYIWTETCFTAN